VPCLGPRARRASRSVVGTVADDVGEGIFDRFDDAPVEFRLGAVHLDGNLLPALRCQVAHHPGQLVPHRPNELHARLHDALLHLRGDQVQALGGGRQAGLVSFGMRQEDLVADKDESPTRFIRLSRSPTSTLIVESANEVVFGPDRQSASAGVAEGDGGSMAGRGGSDGWATGAGATTAMPVRDRRLIFLAQVVRPSSKPCGGGHRSWIGGRQLDGRLGWRRSRRQLQAAASRSRSTW